MENQLSSSILTSPFPPLSYLFLNKLLLGHSFHLIHVYNSGSRQGEQFEPVLNEEGERNN